MADESIGVSSTYVAQKSRRGGKRPGAGRPKGALNKKPTMIAEQKKVSARQRARKYYDANKHRICKKAVIARPPARGPVVMQHVCFVCDTQFEYVHGAQTSSGYVNPFVVFTRDGWTCKICGCDTPRSLRGTLASNAPELDHVVPLGIGGEHSYENTQCACRACNGAKGMKAA